jgi:hypothetical protein
MKPRCQASGGPFSRATSISAVWPTWSRRRIAISPLATKARLSPVSGATVGHGAERHMVQHAEQIRLRPFGIPEAAAAQFPVHRHQRDQHQADGGEMAEAGEIVRPVRVHQRIDLGQFVAGLVDGR